MSAIDLFGGAGGWDEAAEDLGLGKPLGIEWDAAACATREARGLRTLQADVALLDPLDFAPCTVLIASAPCQAFSSGGKGAGRDAMPTYKEAIARMVGGAGMQMSLGAEDAPGVVDVEWLDAACGDPRAHLVLEPLRWALALRPDVVALEQVPPVLPLWEAMADALRGVGYSCWTGLLTSEMFGVPQTRLRAILIARREGVAAAPPPTHARYVAPRSESEADGLLAAPARGRVVRPEDRHLLPWVSMAEALGWGMTERPSVTVTATNGDGGGPRPLDGGAHARALLSDAIDAGRWRVQTNNFTAVERDADGKRSKAGSVPYERPIDAPAPTVDTSVGGWKIAPSWVVDTGNSTADRVWARERPATTVQGDSRVWPPGHKVNAADLAAGRDDYEGRAGENAIRVSVQEAAGLQSFPPDYPWQGTRTAQFMQVGNAIPRLLAWHVLRAATR